MKSVKVTILGRDFFLKSEAEEPYVSHVAEYVNQKLAAVQQNQTLDVISAVILAALNIADDYFQLRSERETLVNAIEKRVAGLSDAIEPWLEERQCPAVSSGAVKARQG